MTVAGIDRASDGLVGIEWMIDIVAGDPSYGDTTFLFKLLVLLKETADGIMAGIDHSWEDWYASKGDPFQGRSYSTMTHHYDSPL